MTTQKETLRIVLFLFNKKCSYVKMRKCTKFKKINLFEFRFGRGQESASNQDSLKALYKQLTAKQEEIDALKEKLEQIKSLPQDIQYLHAALQVFTFFIDYNILLIFFITRRKDFELND